MSNDKTYSVSQVSKIAGISVKTLHHYDKKGLLIPMRNPENGYRYYNQRLMVTLQQILIYRNLDFSIEEIKSLLDENDRNLQISLAKQRDILLEKQNNISQMIKSIDTTMTNLKAKQNYEIFFEDIPKEKIERLEKLTRERKSKEQIENHAALFAKVDSEALKILKKENDDIVSEFAKTIGQPADCKIVQEITQRHYDSISSIQSLIKGEELKLTFDMYVEMANAVDQIEFREICEHYGEGYAEHARAAMLYYAENNLK